MKTKLLRVSLIILLLVAVEFSGILPSTDTSTALPLLDAYFVMAMFLLLFFSTLYFFLTKKSKLLDYTFNILAASIAIIFIFAVARDVMVNI